MIEFKSDPRIVLDLARDRLRYQLSFYDAVDSKVATMFAAGSVLLALLIAVLTVGDRPLTVGPTVTLIVASAFYLILVLATALSHWPRGCRIGPNVEKVWEDAQLKPEGELIPNLISCFAHFYWQNRQMDGRFKPLILRVALLAVLAQTVTVVVGLAFLAA